MKKQTTPYLGISAIVMGVLSFTFFQIIFTPLAIILGVFAIKKGQGKTGVAGIILGTLSALYSLLYLLFIYS